MKLGMIETVRAQWSIASNLVNQPICSNCTVLYCSNCTKVSKLCFKTLEGRLLKRFFPKENEQLALVNDDFVTSTWSIDH